MLNKNTVLCLLAVGLIAGCAKTETPVGAPDTYKLEVGQSGEVESFRIECGAPEEDQKRAGTQAVSLVVYGNPELDNVDTTVSEAERSDVTARRSERKWSAYFDIFHDGDAIDLKALKNGNAVDGYEVTDKVKDNGSVHYGVGGGRVIEIRGVASCIANRGGKVDSAEATVYKQYPKDGALVREVKNKIKLGCTCQFEMK